MHRVEEGRKKERKSALIGELNMYAQYTGRVMCRGGDVERQEKSVHVLGRKGGVYATTG